MTRSRVGVAILLAGLAVHSGPVEAHPDLLEQIELVTEQIEQQPGNAELLVRRADLYRRHEDYAAAHLDFAAARALQPDNHEYDLLEGRLALATGDSQYADALFSSYLAVRPGQAAAWNLRGHARLARGEPALAALDFARAIELSAAPTPVLYRQQAAALVAVGDDQFPAARAAIDAGLARHPGEVSLLGLATDIALAEGQADAAGNYLARLPKGLEVLPQWQARIERAACAARGGSGAAQCAQSARTHLAAQVAAWNSEIPNSEPSD